ncbi:queuine tRNA-ribosyltransferase family protein [Legionella sp. 27cVA30]|uniref:Queuine tRNA-ribosyltransferase n=1 Tax=Legionella septentrionalis TaxID=2498109 RepID=A0A3S1CL87_9GAMM|nr:MULTISPECIES: queuine tRNA-ribosyltransferase [Legionella]MCP0912994.1 queuine tRNA-ribosyltransferase family protein [Legionella sp. 27cVA30]RUQ85339.1 queuine tRNA-ribosyltransferase [Legionella septentrionalis]RUR15366.1 queuine tRNA-ribosyltransferase [Legionella septentrionalis]
MIPILTTAAGNSLTAANWQEIGIKTVSYSLASLLYKPGYRLLRELSALGEYTGWQGEFVLNAILPPAKEGLFNLRSPYDGSHVRISVQELFDLINHLRPKFVLLPAGMKATGIDILKILHGHIVPLFPITDLPQNDDREFGVYAVQEDVNKPFPDFSAHKNKLRYIAGELDFASIASLKHAVDLIESDHPAADAFAGRVYDSSGPFLLTDSRYALDFAPISKDCCCPTCKSKYTRAYLHHLFAHTPLLCQRFLLQHNVFFINQHLDG